VAAPYTIPYRAFVQGDIPRPILGMNVTGINGQGGVVYGIVDSGADTSSFPFGYATLMGYTPATLTPETFRQVGGAGTAYRALAPSTAVVPEIPGVTVQMHPQFVQGSEMVLWGRMDFMRYFNVAFDEPNQQFTITAV
jgi:hypothetical protein